MSNPLPMTTDLSVVAAGATRILIDRGVTLPEMDRLLEALCTYLRSNGIALGRMTVNTRTLHPEIRATAILWRYGNGVQQLHRTHGIEKTEAYLKSPLYEVYVNYKTVRRHLTGDKAVIDYAVLAELKEDGLTDYLAAPLFFLNNLGAGYTVACDRPSGFTDAEIIMFSTIAPSLAMAMELRETRRIARNLLGVYLGQRTGEMVLNGQVQRGETQTIRAAIWFCDMRSFTRHADQASPEALILMLNDFFGAIASAIDSHGGEILKFIGDAVLAIFPIADPQEEPLVCQRTRDAALVAIASLALENKHRQQKKLPPIRYGIGLHVGDVLYGNIGGQTRLDFTVVGPAVNHAARIQALSKDVSRNLLVSAAFARHCPEGLVSLGTQSLRGISEDSEVFYLPSEDDIIPF